MGSYYLIIGLENDSYNFEGIWLSFFWYFYRLDEEVMLVLKIFVWVSYWVIVYWYKKNGLE